MGRAITCMPACTLASACIRSKPMGHIVQPSACAHIAACDALGQAAVRNAIKSRASYVNHLACSHGWDQGSISLAACSRNEVRYQCQVLHYSSQCLSSSTVLAKPIMR